jgi:hypothetical protein
MSLKEKYCPPYSVNLMDEQTLTFKRMLRAEWRELAERVKSELIDAENAKINAEMKDAPAVDRQTVRTRMRDYFEQEVTQARVVRDSSNTPKGIERLLQYALIEKDKAEWLDLIDVAESDLIVSEIVYLPRVKPADPTPLPPPPNEASSGGSASDPSSPNGTDTTPISSPLLPESTPTA